MSSYFTRADNSVLSRWWWTVDKWSLGALAGLIAIGALLTYAASPASAGRIGLDSFHFVRQQAVLLPIALAIMLGVSTFSARWVKRVAVILLGVALLGMLLTLVIGAEYKGASRWLSLFGQSMQPSELMRPTLAVFCAWMLSQTRKEPGFPGLLITVTTVALIIWILVSQPDLGMATLIGSVTLVQLFVAGLPVIWVASVIGTGFVGLVAAYYTLPHVAGRINAFRDPSGSDTYQIDRSLEAFVNGGIFGRGPGEGTVKALLPDAHSDFIFAVAGEEFGLIACLVIVGLYAFVVLRGMARVMEEENFFVVLAATGLLAGFGLQAMVNMASALSLIPTKGMTLPFISYGGSSLMALALGMGMVLALTREGAGKAGHA